MLSFEKIYPFEWVKIIILTPYERNCDAWFSRETFIENWVTKHFFPLRDNCIDNPLENVNILYFLDRDLGYMNSYSIPRDTYEKSNSFVSKNNARFLYSKIKKTFVIQ